MRTVITSIIMLLPFIVTAAWTDLNVTYIERIPHTKSIHGMLEYKQQHLPSLTDRAREQIKKLEPDEGEEITFLCRIVNRSDRAVTAVEAVAYIDGILIKSAVKERMEAGETWVLEVPWKWQKGEHTIQVVVDPQNNIPEDCETNNALTDRIDALGFRFFVTQRCYDDFNSRLNMVGSKSFEDYIQYHLSEMNRTFREAVYPATPKGCNERVRFDQLYICTDNDEIIELKKKLDGSDHQGGWDFDVWDRQDIRATVLDSGLCHELMHQLGIIDIYNLNCAPDKNNILREDGKPVGIGFYWDDQECVMIRCGGWYLNFDEYRFRNGQLVPMEMWGPPLNKLSEHTAAALHIQKGRPRGYFGDYLWAIPEKVNIRILDSGGNSVEGAEVYCYQTMKAGHPHQKAGLNEEPATSGITNSDGKITMKNHPVPDVEPGFQGFTMKPNPFGRVNNHGMESTMFVVINARGQTEYRWLPITALNLAYYTGSIEDYTVTYRTKIPVSDTVGQRRPEIVLDNNTLSWKPVPQAVSYRIYGLNRLATEKDGSWYTFITETEHTLFNAKNTEKPHYAFVITSVDGRGNESAFSRPVMMPSSWLLNDPSGFGIARPGEWRYNRYVFPQIRRWVLSQVEFDVEDIEVGEPVYAVSFRIRPGYSAEFIIDAEGNADGEMYGKAKFSEIAVKFFERERALEEFDRQRR